MRRSPPEIRDWAPQGCLFWRYEPKIGPSLQKSKLYCTEIGAAKTVDQTFPNIAVDLEHAAEVL